MRENFNAVGYLQAENGLGEATRLLLAAADSVDLAHREISISGAHRNLHPFQGVSAFEAPCDKNVVCVNADVYEPIAEWIETTPLAGRPTAAWWAWELEEFPRWMAERARHVDAIWTNGTFARDAIRKVVDAPVHSLNPPVPLRDPRRLSRAALGLPDGLVFLFCFDYHSVFERKNPIAAVEAFKRAFPTPGRASLVVKGVNADAHPLDRDLLLTSAGDRPDILIWHGYLNHSLQEQLMGACDAYVSLHRSEGFGLTLAEALALGKPVIATGYSGNLDFMDESNSFLVGYTDGAVPNGCDPYPAGAKWAEPNIDEAATAMQQVASDAAEVARRVARARESLVANHSLEVRGRYVSELLAALSPRPRAAARPRLPSRQRLSGSAKARVRAVARRLAGVEALESTVRSLHEATAQQITRTSEDLSRLTAKVDDPPFTSNIGALRTVDDKGREQMGFMGGNAETFATSFHELFRGTEPFVRELLRCYVEVVVDHEPVLDVACGRGEFLDLLRDRGVEASGVDADPAATERARAKGHRVHTEDALAFVAALPDHSVGTVFSSQFVEHLPVNVIEEFIAQSHRVLAPGGLLVLETVNPHSLAALRTFWLDPTHVSPIFPETLLLLCRAAGFAEGRVMHPNGTGDYGDDSRVSGAYAILATTAVSGPGE